ncbi:HEAT repeat domain-containing protein [Haloarchaeobius sp. HRN-SO-5]|uniref:HEAT repeat domain-containing protein n=1 Tax=Haloarchaeobius sp. HRN-SO-5 TaxID=3446118 RepID=UPI003EBF63EB
MLVFAFDRDWTVDVNPHPNREAVPLTWVRHLAHETDHAVYAIGNQSLAEEAAIPGVVDVVGRHADDWDDWLGEKGPDGRYERFPTRRERLSLVADLHPDADGYVVVDDLDLGDVDGWDHYHAWEFVPAVERGDVDPSLPWAREPVTDGGLPSSAGIVPMDASMLSSFLDEHGDAAGFELTYVDDGTERTRLCHSVSLDAVRLERPSVAPAIQCTPVSPGGDRFIVPLDDIELLSVVDPPPDRYTADAETPAETAAGLKRLASVDPDAVHIPTLLGLFEHEADGPLDTLQRNALRALRHVAFARPEECTPAVPVLRSGLATGTFQSPADALVVLRAIADADPGAVAHLAGELVPYLDSNNVTARREATRCIAAVAEEWPADAVDAVPGLATVVEDDADGLKYALYALSRVAREYPEEVKPVAETLAESILDESLSDSVRLNATSALGQVVDEYPGVAVDIVDDVVPLFDADDHKLRNNAIALLADVAVVHTDVVEPYADEIAALLTADDDYTRINASGTLSRVAEDFPASVEHAIPTFLDLLSDDEPLVRENACWALGHLRAPEATANLKERARQDETVEVRTRAAWALARIERC